MGQTTFSRALEASPPQTALPDQHLPLKGKFYCHLPISPCFTLTPLIDMGQLSNRVFLCCEDLSIETISSNFNIYTAYLCLLKSTMSQEISSITPCHPARSPGHPVACATNVGSRGTPGTMWLYSRHHRAPAISCTAGQSLHSQTRSNKFLFFSWKQLRWRRAGRQRLCCPAAQILKALKEHHRFLILSMFPPKSFLRVISSLLSHC